MKKLFPLLALVCCLFLLWGCPEPEPEPIVDPEQQTYTMEPVSAAEYPEISAEGGEFTIKFKTDADASIVKPSSDVSWITVATKTKAVTTQVVTIVVQPNTGVDSRHGNVTIKAGKSSLSFKISQTGVTPRIDIAITEYSVPAEGGKVSVNVESNVTYQVAIDVDWIKQDGDGFKVEANDSQADRSGRITFSYGEISKSVTVTQAGKEEEPYITVGGTSFSVPAAGGDVTVEVLSNVEYKTTIGADWVSGAVPTFKVAANSSTKERSTTITFSYENISKSVTITQAGKPEDPYINVDSPVVSVPAAGDSFTLNVTSNVQYETSVSASWVTVNGKNVTVAENKEYVERSATITFSYGSVVTTVTINQAAAVEPDVLEYVGNDPTFYVAAEGAAITVKIRTNVNYNTAISANWITEGTKTIREDEKTFIVAANDGDEREATITFSYANLKSVVTVKQVKKPNTEQPYIQVVTKNYNVPAAGGTFTVDVTSNVDYSTEIGASWVTMNGKTMTVAENTAYEPRSTTVTFSYQGISESITVSQAAAVEPDELEFVGGTPTLTVPAEGGNISFKVRTNGEFGVRTSASWLTQVTTKASREEELTFAAAANTGDARTAVITITLGSIELTTTVQQAAYVPQDKPYLTLNPASIEVEAEGGVVDVMISTNCEGYEVINGSDWVSEAAISGGYRFTIAANPNALSRSANIYFMHDDLEDEVVLTITQAAREENENPFDVGSNLSVNGTANSYVVIKAGDYSFDASVMGNGADGFIWDEGRAIDALLWPQNAAKTEIAKAYTTKPAKAFVLWDEGGVVTNVKYNSASKTITFTATGNKGAALIGLYDKYATKDDAMYADAFWSWMIWCTDTPEHKRHLDLEENEYVLLDRNIGATSTNPADGKATYGYYFQWGRPTPMRAYIGMAADFKDCEADMIGPLQHPYYVYNSGTHTNEWYNTGRGHLFNVTADLWGDPRHMFATVGEDARDYHPQMSQPGELRKTIYDPCPPGYMVPSERVWALAGLQDDDVYPIKFIDEGVILQTENGDSFYPYAGYIATLQTGEDANKNKLGWFGFKGYKDVLPPEGSGHKCHDYRTQASVYTSTTGNISIWGDESSQWELYGAKFFYLSPDSAGWDMWTGSCLGSIRQKGFPVRCMKELNKK